MEFGYIWLNSASRPDLNIKPRGGGGGDGVGVGVLYYFSSEAGRDTVPSSAPCGQVLERTLERVSGCSEALPGKEAERCRRGVSIWRGVDGGGCCMVAVDICVFVCVYSNCGTAGKVWPGLRLSTEITVSGRKSCAEKQGGREGNERREKRGYEERGGGWEGVGDIW